MSGCLTKSTKSFQLSHFYVVCGGGWVGGVIACPHIIAWKELRLFPLNKLICNQTQSDDNAIWQKEGATNV